MTSKEDIENTFRIAKTILEAQFNTIKTQQKLIEDMIVQIKELESKNILLSKRGKKTKRGENNAKTGINAGKRRIAKTKHTTV